MVTGIYLDAVNLQFSPRLVHETGWANLSRLPALIWLNLEHIMSGIRQAQPTAAVDLQAPRVLYRLPEVLKRIPVSRSAWYRGIQEGKYPRGVALGPNTTAWRSSDIDQLISSLSS